MVAFLLLMIIVALIVLAAANDPDNRRLPGQRWQEDTEYFGL
jgi:hypothetical protein